MLEQPVRVNNSEPMFLFDKNSLPPHFVACIFTRLRTLTKAEMTREFFTSEEPAADYEKLC